MLEDAAGVALGDVDEPLSELDELDEPDEPDESDESDEPDEPASDEADDAVLVVPADAGVVDDFDERLSFL